MEGRATGIFGRCYGGVNFDLNGHGYPDYGTYLTAPTDASEKLRLGPEVWKS